MLYHILDAAFAVFTDCFQFACYNSYPDNTQCNYTLSWLRQNADITAFMLNNDYIIVCMFFYPDYAIRLPEYLPIPGEFL